LNPRTLKIALAVSVALNLFAVAAGATLLIARDRIEDRVEDQRRAPRSDSMMALVEQVDPAVRQRVRESIRASALAAKPDFDEARRKRREAVALAEGGTLDATRIRALLDESTAAEMRGRTRMETDAVALLGTLEADDRAALAVILTRRGRTAAAGDRKDRPPAPQAPAPARP
jgi:uncharacterized membrane protein